MKRLSTRLWERHRATILRLYLDQGHKLNEVMSLMEEQHDFQASRTAYKKKLGRWGISKRLKPSFPSSIQDIDEASLGPYASVITWTLPLLADAAQQHSIPGNIVPEGGYESGPRGDDDVNSPPCTGNFQRQIDWSTPETESNNVMQDQVDPIDYTAGLYDPFYIDFNDEREQETERFFARFASILQTMVQAGGFARAMISEALESLFVPYETRRDFYHLERVLAAYLLIFGSNSSVFLEHARRFCHLAQTSSRPPEQQDSILVHALLLVIGPSHVRGSMNTGSSG